MKKVYFLSGLGADKRVFSFLDLSFCESIFIDWIRPLKEESLKSYALRIRQLIPDSHPIIIGISLGGMIVTEMAKADKKIKAIIISSNKTSDEFPRYLRVAQYFPLYKWLPSIVIKKTALAFKWTLGVKGKEQKKTLREIILDSDITFMKWAINALLHWKNKEVPDNLIHIHGTADKLLPYRMVKANYAIQGGNHVMPMNDHKEISALLKKLIQ
jgi:pimeloyl-ACP methyl ester carboxylesterase